MAGIVVNDVFRRYLPSFVFSISSISLVYVVTIVTIVKILKNAVVSNEVSLMFVIN